MYTTIEADIQNRQVIGLEAMKLPEHAHVLITLLKSSEGDKKYDFSSLAGRLQWKGNAVEEQRKLRDEW